MRILFVGNVARDIWNFRRDLLHALATDGYEVLVAAPDDASVPRISENWPFFPISNLSRKGLNPFRDLALTLELWKLYRLLRPDLVVHYTIKPNVFGSISAFLARVPSVAVVAGMGYLFTRKLPATYIASALYRLAALLSHKVLFLNREDLRDFESKGMIPGGSSKSVLLPGEGIDTELFAPALGFEFRDTGHGDFIFIGRLLRDKGIVYFLEAARAVRKVYPEVTFRVLGPFDHGNPQCIDEDLLNSYVEDGSVTYLGSADDIRPYLQTADVLVLPTFYGEGLPRSILEAMSMGKPVISSDNRGCTPLIKEGVNGQLVPMKDGQALQKALICFIGKSTEERALMGNRSREIVKEGFCNGRVHEIFRGMIKEIQAKMENSSKNMILETGPK